MKESTRPEEEDGDLLSLESYPNKTDRVYDILLKNITKRNFSPGAKLGEQYLADELGVSKTPVREALSRLERENLVDIYPNRGAYVVEIAQEDIIEIYDLREVLEGLAARQTAEKIDRSGINRFRELINSMEESLNKEDLEEYADHDSKFHSLLGRISENSRLQNVVQNLRYQARILMASSVQIPGRAEKSLRDHKEIFKFLEAGAGSKAEQKVRKHTRDTKEVVLENYDEAGNSAQ
ncbi:GntR family transcriptional regulator [Candidatus Bipolaricaulota bacterium]|nr:GntR family transcriptional regulator [Candidatus Bipolaricaulota bacterium]